MVTVTQKEDVVIVQTKDNNLVAVNNQENQTITVTEKLQQINTTEDVTQPQYQQIVLAQTIQLFTEEAKMYATRIDFTNGGTIIYRGEAAPGSLETDAVWRIRKITILSDNDVIVEFADGDENFDNIWTNHLTLNYS